jgi:hypothetical protein
MIVTGFVGQSAASAAPVWPDATANAAAAKAPTSVRRERRHTFFEIDLVPLIVSSWLDAIC